MREYWMIDPRPGKERADSYWLTEQRGYQAIVPYAEGRYHSHILPGFWFRTAWLWQDPLPQPSLKLAEIRGVSPGAVQTLPKLLKGKQ